MHATQLPENAELLGKLICQIVRYLVAHPQAVTVRQITSAEPEGKIGLCLRVAAGDMGRVVGFNGVTARALRTIVAAAGMKAKRHFDLCICEQVPAFADIEEEAG